MTDSTTRPAPAGTQTRSGAYRAYHVALGVFLLCGAVQIFLAGLGVFGGGGGPGIDPHRYFALVLAGLALVIAVLAAVARAGTRAIVLSVLIFVLVFLVQGFLAAWGQEDSAWFGGLHALDGLLIIGLAGFLFGTSSDAVSGRRPGTR
jgi:hypothetical protein